jgi:hypothetical protein
MVQINNVIILILRIELTKVDKLEHKIDFKLFFLSKTAKGSTSKTFIWILINYEYYLTHIWYR